MESGEHEESFLTVAEVAEILKLNQQTVRNWIDQGSLPALRVGRRVRIKRSDFERVLEESYSSGTGAAPPDRGPSAEDFWGGTPVGLAEPDPLSDPPGLPDSDPSHPSPDGDGSVTNASGPGS
jgi:excisionase family DNA binding protein